MAKFKILAILLIINLGDIFSQSLSTGEIAINGRFYTVYEFDRIVDFDGVKLSPTAFYGPRKQTIFPVKLKVNGKLINYTHSEKHPLGLCKPTLSQSGTEGLLEWKTLYQARCSGWSVEFSENLKQWESIGWVSGAGSSRITRCYSYLVESPGYYRLAQETFSGETTYSDPVSKLPNYQVSGKTLHFDALVRWELYNISGQCLASDYSQDVDLFDGINFIQTPLGVLKLKI